MAGDVTYADVAMLPRERPQGPSQAPGPGNTITYAELRVKPKPEGDSRPETSSPGCQHRCSLWFHVALILGFLVLSLLAIIAIQAMKISKDAIGRSGRLFQYGLNGTISQISSEDTISAGLLRWLMEELCDHGHGTRCELCHPGWHLHRGRCYYFSEESRSWDDSQKNCQSRKSQLLVIEDGIEMEYIDYKEKEPRYIWIAGNTQGEKKRSSFEDHGVKGNRTAQEGSADNKACPVYRRKDLIESDHCPNLKRWICKKNATLLVL